MSTPDHTDAGLPTLPFWQARSFWLTVLTVVSGVFSARGVDLASALGYHDTGALTDAFVAVANGVGAALPIVSAVLAWRERLNPRHRLSLR